MEDHAVEFVDLLRKAKTGDAVAVEELLRQYRPRILRMITVRIDPRIRGRVDQSDVVQETFLEVSRRLPKYLETHEASFFLWIRKIAHYKLIDLHRRHLDAQARSVEQELSLGRSVSSASTFWLAQQLVDRVDTPSRAVIRQETITALQQALDSMSPDDREVLVLRQFEEMSNQQTARELGIEPAAASKRFVRALQRLQFILVRLGLDPSAK